MVTDILVRNKQANEEIRVPHGGRRNWGDEDHMT